MTATNSKLHQHNLTMAIEKIIFRKLGEEKRLTANQETLISELINYFNGEKKPRLGILLIGNIGSGKTTIMEAVTAYYQFLNSKIVPKFHAKELPKQYSLKGIEYFYKRPLFIDDLGKESPITTIWGQKYDTWGDMFAVRYENRAVTFATANYNFESFSELYGEVIVDRMKEHFNIMILKGGSLRE